MRKILNAIGVAFAILLVIVFTLVLSPLIIGALVVFGMPQLYASLWAKIRHDPKKDLAIEELRDDTWAIQDTREGFVEAFTRLSDSLAKLSKSRGSEITYTGFGVFYDGPREVDWAELSLMRTLKSKHAEVELTLNLGAHSSRTDDQRLLVSMPDGDDQHGPFPPLAARVVTSDLRTKRSFTVWSSKDAWVVICFLRGDVKFVQPSGQLWAYIPEHNVWLVEYKTGGLAYGQRTEFTNTFARRFGKDAVAEILDGND